MDTLAAIGTAQIACGAIASAAGLTAAGLQVRHMLLARRRDANAKKGDLDALDATRKWLTLVASCLSVAVFGFTQWKSSLTAEVRSRELEDMRNALDSANAAASAASAHAADLERRLQPRTLARPDVLTSRTPHFNSKDRLPIVCDSPQRAFANEVMSAIAAANWNGIALLTSDELRLTPGMAVYVANDESEHAKDMARELANAMWAAGASDLSGVVFEHPPVNASGGITLLIGARR